MSRLVSEFGRRRAAAQLRRTKLAPFDQHKAIFVHIPKTGGVSISKALFGHEVGHHRTIHQYKNIFGEDVLELYFKFSFVRNPWDRFVSAYCYLRSGGMHETDSAWAAAHLLPYDSFGEFVAEWVSPSNVRTWRHFKPQVDFICECDGKLLVDHVGRFENLDQDFQIVADRLGISNNLKHLNQSSRRDYRSYYDRETRRIIGEVYEDDVARFGYSFE